MNPTLRKAIISLLVGAMSVGLAWAGAGLVPIKVVHDDDKTAAVEGASSANLQEAAGETQAAAVPSFDLANGQILAGAWKESLKPNPDAYTDQFPGAHWETNYEKCQTLPPPEFEPEYPQRLAAAIQEGASHVGDTRVRWHENTNCLYMGGYGLGPMFPITSWDDEYGLWTRSVAMSDGQDTLVLTLIDAVYWEAVYNSMCEGCGFAELAEKLAAEYGYTTDANGNPVPGENGITPDSFVFASTHSHTAPDFIGGWGGVPRWYMQQSTDALLNAARTAVARMQPAVLEAGEVLARQFNGERRDFYRSAEDDGFSWFRLVAANDLPAPEVCTTPAPEPSPTPTKKPKKNDPPPTPAPAPTPICEPAREGSAIATVGAYAAHPVTADESSGRGDADFPAVFAKRVEERFKGVGMFLQTGLGNMSPRGNKVEMGNGLASLVPAIDAANQVKNTDLRVGRTFWEQPVTNVPLGSLGVAGFFDRKFNEAPARVMEGKGPDNKKCHSASPISVRTSVSAAKIGSLWITGGPGELFSNLTNTIEERNPNGVTLALGLVNDGLGYIVQSFETDHVGRQGVGFVGGGEVPEESPVAPGHGVGLSEYEDAYSIDHCFGDAVLEKTIGLLGQL